MNESRSEANELNEWMKRMNECNDSFIRQSSVNKALNAAQAASVDWVGNPNSRLRSLGLSLSPSSSSPSWWPRLRPSSSPSLGPDPSLRSLSLVRCPCINFHLDKCDKRKLQSAHCALNSISTSCAGRVEEFAKDLPECCALYWHSHPQSHSHTLCSCTTLLLVLLSTLRLLQRIALINDEHVEAYWNVIHNPSSQSSCPFASCQLSSPDILLATPWHTHMHISYTRLPMHMSGPYRSWFNYKPCN